jgi:acyl-coenzyme A thioesterase PaaI-like protein
VSSSTRWVGCSETRRDGVGEVTAPGPSGPAPAGEPGGAPELSLQERYAPGNACFGCGPSNAKGLRLKSHLAANGELVATFRPEPHHEAFPGVLNGGIIGALLDCHSNWAAAITLMRERGEASPPCTVTAEFHVRLRAPTPSNATLALVARAQSAEGRCTVDAELSCGGKVTATCRGTFVAVKEGHPAYHRW